MDSERKPVVIGSAIAVAFLCGALLDEDSLGTDLFGYGYDLDWPYGYYILVRFPVCIGSAIIAVLGHQWQRHWVPWVFGAQAVLYNPLIRVHLNVEAWTFLNLIAIALFAAAVFAVKPSSSREPATG